MGTSKYSTIGSEIAAKKENVTFGWRCSTLYPARDRDQLSVILTSVVNSLFCFARLVVAPHL
jgi:hypothetical protein